MADAIVCGRERRFVEGDRAHRGGCKTLVAARGLICEGHYLVYLMASVRVFARVFWRLCCVLCACRVRCHLSFQLAISMAFHVCGALPVYHTRPK